MVIHERIVIDMESGAVLSDAAYEYAGPLALCGGSGGGSSTTNTVDYGYNYRMATLSEEQQNWAREYFNVWQQYQKPYEIAQAKANLKMLPYETDLYKDQLKSADSLLPYETRYLKSQYSNASQAQPYELELYKKQLQASSELLPYETEWEKQKYQQASRLLGSQADAYASHINAANNLLPLEERFAATQFQNAIDQSGQEANVYAQGLAGAGQLLGGQIQTGTNYLNAANKGVDINERMALASVDVANAWKNARAETNRANARLGVNPNSGRYQGVMAAQDTQKAAQLAGARTQARVAGEQENFARLQAASGYNGAGATISAVNPLKANPQIQTGQILAAGQTVRPDSPSGQASSSVLASSQVIKPSVSGGSNTILQGLGYLKG